MNRISSILLLTVFFLGCEKQAPKEIPLSITEDTETVKSRAEALESELPLELYEGVSAKLWASDSLAPDPIAMSIDNAGNVYLTRTNRQKNSEFDIRGYTRWMTRSISLTSVEDRRAFLREEFAPEKSEENSWLPDLNEDGSHDWKDLAVEKDEVWKLTDTNGDGYADVSKRILEDFDTEVTDVAGALLVRENDVFVGVGPDMWRLEDTNDDEVLDKKTSISTGYAVHIGFSGHGMSGAIQGPDGRIYWGIGDIGANITDLEGNTYEFPNEGVIVRSEPDGSNFEVFAHGLRNTHEFVFDPHGNLISADNDGDHRGESERLVHIVEGSDAGWRANWQYGKYTDPRNNDYKVWMEERLYQPRWEGQAAHIIPPIQNYHNGPTGMVFNPGTALGPEWKDHFFLVEFVGNPSRSAIWAFTLKPEGVSFALEQEKKMISGILPTGIRFGPDGALYAADWINGWGTKDYGRVWKLDVTNKSPEVMSSRERTQELIQSEFPLFSENDLAELLEYEDMRIRLKAQFELAMRNVAGVNTFTEVLNNSSNQYARLHSVWGIGQLARKNSENAAILLGFLEDQDTEVVAQVLKTLGDLKFIDAAPAILAKLNSDNPRVKFYAAEALGRMEYAEALNPLIEMLAENNDEDVYLRHAAVLALTRIGDADALASLSTDERDAVRLGAVLALRRLQDEQIRNFLTDKNEYILEQVAMAINDDLSIEAALPDLAALLTKQDITSEPIIRRAINAALRVGNEQTMNYLLGYVRNANADPEMVAEGIAALGTWASPSVLDRVDGRYRGEFSRDPLMIKASLEEIVGDFLNNSDDRISGAALGAISELNLDGFDGRILALLQNHPSPEIRAAALNSLAAIDYDALPVAVNLAMNDRAEEVRGAAISLIPSLDMDVEQYTTLIDPIFKRGSLREQQELLNVLTDLPSEVCDPIVGSLTEKLLAGEINPSLRLDIQEVVERTGNQELSAQLASLSADDPNSVASFQETLYGGDAGKGWQVLNEHPAAQCLRCHSFEPDETAVGPSLGGIANKLTREQLLEALIEPSARIAPGYGTVMLTLKDGQNVSGVLMEESAEELVLKTSEAEPLHIPVARISDRRNAPSGMPPMGTLLTRREIRDLVELLSRMD